MKQKYKIINKLIIVLPIPMPTKNLTMIKSQRDFTNAPARATIVTLTTADKKATLRPNLSDKKPNRMLPKIHPAKINILATVPKMDLSQTKSNFKN